MAERRMFAKSIVLSDAFLDMPATAKCLYYNLSMYADDDGFVGSPKGVMRISGASQNDLNKLLEKRFILGFKSGVVVIKHWRINNQIRKDRSRETTYVEERETLELDGKGAYREKVVGKCQPSDNQPMATEVSIGKVSIVKNSNSIHPTADQVREYLTENNLKIDAEKFIDYYTAQGWKLSNGQPLKDWKAACRNWARRDNEKKTEVQSKAHNFQERKDDLNRLY